MSDDGRLAQRLRQVVLLALLAVAQAVHAWAPPFPIIDAGERNSLGLYLAWHEDVDGKLDVDAVTRLDPDAFTVSEQDILHFGFRRSTIWLRVALQNTRPHDESLVLEVPHPSLATIDFYRQGADGWQVTRSGTASERIVGDIDYQHYLYRVTVPASSTSVYWFRIRSDLALDFSLNAEAPESFSLVQSTWQIATGVFIGILVGLVLFNAIAWGVSRQSTYAWYLLLLVSVIVFLLARLGYVGVLFVRSPGVQPLAESLAAVAATIAGLQFARAFLATRVLQPLLDSGLRHLLLASLVVLVATPFVEPWHRAPMYMTLAALAMPATLWAGWRAWREGYRDANRYFMARLVSATVGGLSVLADTGTMPLPLLAVHLLVLSAFTEALIIAWALFVRAVRAREQVNAARVRDAVASAETRARNEFLSRFSHDVRTPLNGILGMTELLADTTLTPRQREYTLTIRSSGENLLLLLNDALDWSRLQAGQLDLQPTEFSLQQLVADSIETVQLRAEEKHIELVVDIDPALPDRLYGDPARLRQVLCNLLGNGVRFTHRGEVKLSVHPAAAPGMLRFEVRDTGVGIPRERLAGLFEPAPADSASNRGFGLVIARQLVQRMDGHIHVASEEHRGSTFWFEVPLPPAPLQEPAKPEEYGILEGKRLLVADDNAAVRRVLETQATTWGMQVTTADNGQEALAVARTQANLGSSFDAVVVDHNMPGMSGLQLAGRIKEDPLIRHDALIIMLTGLNIAPTDTMARNVGIRRVLTKPVSGNALRTVLVEEFTRRERYEPEPGTVEPLPENMRVLVVEDSVPSQKVIRGTLAKLGVRSDVVSNGQEALDALHHHNYDLVLMDCEMPVLDGYEATRRIRAWEADTGRRHMPIVALTAHILQEIKDRCQLSGMDAYMAKPVDLNELRATLRIYAGNGQ